MNQGVVEGEVVSSDQPKRKYNGTLPDGHPRRCQAKFKRTPGRLCKRAAMKGTNYCPFHGGKSLLKRKYKSTKVIRDIAKMPVVYRKYLNKTLNDALEAQLGVKPSEQLQILEELALLRDFAGQSVAVYSATREAAEKNPGHNDKVMAAGAFMAECLGRVSKMAEAAAKITSSTSNVDSIHDIQYIVFQIIRIMYQVCGPNNEQLAIEFERRVHRDLVLPKTPEGTTKEPHHDVEDMDSSVPKFLEESEV
jgi:hypothetical protein